MRRNRSYLFFAAFAFPIFFVLQNPSTSESIHLASLTMMRPFLQLGHETVRAGHEMQRQTVTFWRTFQENRYAYREIEDLRSQLLTYSELQNENTRLRELLKFRDSISEKKTAARVIGWDPSLARKMILLDKGKSQGVRKDSPVVVSDGLVGRVLQASEAASRAILLIDPEARVSAVTSDSRAQGVVAGDGSHHLHMIYLDLDSGVQVGETVLTSGVGELFPKGIRVGRILSITKSEDGLHLTAEMEPFVRFSKLEEVVCLGSSRAK